MTRPYAVPAALPLTGPTARQPPKEKPLRQLKTTIAVLALPLALVGCGESNRVDTADVAAAQAASAPPSASPSNAPDDGSEQGSTRDYDEISFTELRSIQQWQQGWNEKHCSTQYARDVLCSADLFAAEMKATTLKAKLEGAQNPEAPAYIGDVPEEREEIVASTIEKADEVIQDAGEMQSLDCGANPARCNIAALQFGTLMDELESKLTGWDSL